MMDKDALWEAAENEAKQDSSGLDDSGLVGELVA